MSVARKLTRAVALLVLVVSCFGAAGTVYALDPPRPLPGYRPAFVTEREPGPWEDCTWAAASMLLDKWSNGITSVGRDKLRKLSGDTEGGSNLGDVQRAFKKLGFNLPWSPNGGESTAWPELLDRLGQGGGAILGGDYGHLPRHYGRWAPDTWAGELDDHALYLDAYDAQRGRILVMDPLAPAGWAGEWIPVEALKQFAWRGRNGALWVAMTPTAAPAPFAGVTFGTPSPSADSAALTVTWPIDAAPEAWVFPGATARATIEAVAAAGPADLIVGALPPNEAVRPLAGPSVETVDALLSASIPLPAAPGTYRVTVTVTDDRTGAVVASVGPLILFRPGPRAARFVVPEASSAEAGRLTPISFGLSNVGSVSWLDPLLPSSAALDVERMRNARLVGMWVRQDAPASEDPSGDLDAIAAHGPPPAFEATGPLELGPLMLGPLRLEPGYGQRVEALIRMPAEPGMWRLVVDIVDVEGSFAAAGSAPGVIVIEVLATPFGNTLQ